MSISPTTTPRWEHLCTSPAQQALHQAAYTNNGTTTNEAYDLYRHYHDTEWGVPCRDEQTLFEFLILEGAQAGLSWITILRKRENYRAAMHGFDAERMARYGDDEVARLMNDAGIVRNRLKIEGAIANARATCALRDAGGSLTELFWKHVDNRPVINHWRELSQVPVHTPAAQALSKELKQRGFKFIGPTVIYAHMQAMGMVNDHLVDCCRHADAAMTER